MKIAALLVFLLFYTECEADNQLDKTKLTYEKGSEIGKYKIAKYYGKLVHELVYNTIGYCTKEFPEKAGTFLKAKNAWNSRNLPFINSSKYVVRNWRLSNGIDQKTVDDLSKKIIKASSNSFSNINADMIILELFAEPRAKKTKKCSFIAGYIAGGGYDIKILLPEGYKFFEKYSKKAIK